MAGAAEQGIVSAVRGYLSDVLGCSADRIRAVDRFEEGNRHAVYKASYLDAAGLMENVVVRVSYSGSPADAAQAEQEATLVKKVGGVAGPVLYDFRLTCPWFDTPVMCMQFVAGEQGELSAMGLARIRRLGSVVAWLHAQPVDELLDGSPMGGSIARYAETRLTSILSGLAWVRPPLPDPIRARLNHVARSVEVSLEARRASASFSTDEPLALLHGDIAIGNILWGPDPVLIDWEYARVGDPADEIAYTFDQNGLAPDQRRAFWQGYRASGAGRSRLAHVAERVAWWEPVTLLGSTLWWVERWVRRTQADVGASIDPVAPRDPGYYFQQVVRRLDRLEELLARRP